MHEAVHRDVVDSTERVNLLTWQTDCDISKVNPIWR